MQYSLVIYKKDVARIHFCITSEFTTEFIKISHVQFDTILSMYPNNTRKETETTTIYKLHEI